VSEVPTSALAPQKAANTPQKLTERPKQAKPSGKKDNQQSRDRPATLPAGPPGSVLDLTACRLLALRNQPAIAAARASLDAAHASAHALDNLHVPRFLARDLPVRKQQAAIGIIIAEAGVREAENNALYGVTYAYLGYLYAHEQVLVADRAVTNLKELRKKIKPFIEPGRREKPREGTPEQMSEQSIELIDVYLRVAAGRREEALAGASRAKSLLHEVLGLGPDCPVCPAQARLLDVNVLVDCRQVVLLALDRRPELVKASYARQVNDLEIAAQDAKHHAPSVRTFASGSDIHSHPLPAESFDPGYRPGAVGPEMPGSLNGPRCDRVAQAHIYSERAGVVLAKTRSLIVLEAEQAYLRWAEASKKLPEYEKAAQDARTLVEKMRDGLVDYPTNARFRELLETAILATQLRVQVNETRYHLLLALAQLERSTAGGFSPHLETAPTVADKVEKKDAKSDKKKKADENKQNEAKGKEGRILERRDR
jgi:outer membrane protein TolC